MNRILKTTPDTFPFFVRFPFFAKDRQTSIAFIDHSGNMCSIGYFVLVEITEKRKRTVKALQDPYFENTLHMFIVYICPLLPLSLF